MADAPINQVLQLKSQGYSNQQIAESLRSQGFDPASINEAIAQADAKGGVDGTNFSPQGRSDIAPPLDDSMGSDEEDDGTEIEELIEEIIEEKWKELVKDIKKIIEWKDTADEKITKMQQSFDDLKSNFDNLHKALIGKIGDYDKNIVEVGTEIKAMEKVFEKVLPRFTENVNDLSRITKTMMSKFPDENN
ncbi:hypothetical protein JXM83_03025 [Candidatus Woesearchaeota archaeon]|nr:hypothetical protein [Candidatus Woesearchaeota archaeon]